MNIYLIGSLRNPRVPEVAERLRDAGYTVFDDWYAAGPEADDKWKDYEQSRGHSYTLALMGFAAKHVVAFDKFHLDQADAAILVAPAGRSGHLELGYALGQGKFAGVLLDEAEEPRWDVMYGLCSAVGFDLEFLEVCLAHWAGGTHGR